MSYNINMKRHNKGIAIFITLMILFLLSLVVIAVLLTGYNYSNISEGQIKRLKAITSAEAGVYYAYNQLMNEDPASPTRFSVEHNGAAAPDGTPPANAYTFLISDPVMNGITSLKVWVEDKIPFVAGEYIIKSKATYPKSSTL